jgi:hypothetical protein
VLRVGEYGQTQDCYAALGGGYFTLHASGYYGKEEVEIVLIYEDETYEVIKHYAVFCSEVESEVHSMRYQYKGECEKFLSLMRFQRNALNYFKKAAGYFARGVPLCKK